MSDRRLASFFYFGVYALVLSNLLILDVYVYLSLICQDYHYVAYIHWIRVKCLNVLDQEIYRHTRWLTGRLAGSRRGLLHMQQRADVMTAILKV